MKLKGYYFIIIALIIGVVSTMIHNYMFETGEIVLDIENGPLIFGILTPVLQLSAIILGIIGIIKIVKEKRLKKTQ